MNIHKNPIYKIASSLKTKYTHWLCDRRRKPYIPVLHKALLDSMNPDAQNLAESGISMICSNCFAGRIMQDIGMEYNTPTLGLYFWAPDYIEFLSNLEYYLKEAKLQFVEHSKYPEGDQRRANWRHWYPIGQLGGKVEIHFLHYYTEEEAASKWYRRAARVNIKKLFIIGMDQNHCTEKEIRKFDKLPFQHKVFFSRYNIDCQSNIYMPEYRKKDGVGDPYRKGELFYKRLIDYLANSK